LANFATEFTFKEVLMYGTLRDYHFSDQAEDIRGSAIYGSDDEKLGKIDDVIFDQNTGRIQHVIVDTGGWLSSRKFLVPADRLSAYEREEGGFLVNLTKAQIERFPTFNEDVISSEDRYRDYESRYWSSWPEESSSSRMSRFYTFEDRLRRDRERIAQQRGYTVASAKPIRERKVG
jgi:sporulation protein YlmC with PRC-barrel domain